MEIIIFTSTCLNTSSGSVETTLNILNNLPADYKVNLVLIDNLVPKDRKLYVKNPNLFSHITVHPKVLSVNNLEVLSIDSLKKLGSNAIIAIYNYFGEDGILPALCSLAGIKILSTSSSSSAVCFDKNWAKNILKSAGVMVPRGVALDLNDKNISKSVESFFKECNNKIILKPVTCGASRGCSVCTEKEQISEAIKKVASFSDQILCEEFIEGEEYTIGFMHLKNKLNILPPVEIVTERQFFDYKAKYEDVKTKEICPAQTLKSEILEKIHYIIKLIVKIFKIEAHARVDFMVANGKIYVLEINTFPGLMENSLFPKELKAAGISMSEFIANSFQNM